ncbi:MAG: ZIP family metal transporter [Nitrospirota bacterium]|nr:ZIP family metal transporter [Nitrospirota bacterium]MDE3242995.1 ZIP family metal transporter [Nitrospirota bacterium]
MTLLWVLGFVLLGSVGAVCGAGLFLLFPERMRRVLIPYVISYATGTLLAAALLGLLPEAMEQAAVEPVLALVLAGLVVFFILERLMVWRHCHMEGPCETHHNTAGYLILVGDALHNFVDGAVIAAAFLSSIPLGIATGLAVIAHELPQEVGDFGILLDSGFGRSQAFLWNTLSASASVPGALAAYVALDQVEHLVPSVLALSAASFLYIGLADLVPGLHGRIGANAGLGQFGVMLLGVGTIALFRLHHG